MAKQWDKLAAKARKIAKNIVTGEEEYKGTRLTAIVYRLDTFATDALNRKYARQGSQASIHTEWGGYQTIDSIHEDGSEGHFDTDGKCESSDNAMDIEIMMYINGGNGGGNNGGSTPSSAPVRRIRESKTRKDMKQNRIKLTESQLKQMIKEAVDNVLNEIGNTPQGQYMLGRLAGRKLQQANASLNKGNGNRYMNKMQDADNISAYARQAQNSSNTSDYGDDETYFDRGKKDLQWYRPGSKGMPR